MAATASVTAGSGSYSEDQFGKKIDRCITDTLVKAGMYEKIRNEKFARILLCKMSGRRQQRRQTKTVFSFPFSLRFFCIEFVVDFVILKQCIFVYILLLHTRTHKQIQVEVS